MSSAIHLEAILPSGTFSSFSKQHSIDTLVLLTHENFCQKKNLLLQSHEIFCQKNTSKETTRFFRQCLRRLLQSCHQRLMRNHLRIMLTFRICFLSSRKCCFEAHWLQKRRLRKTLRLLRVVERNKERQLTLQVSWWRWFGDRGLSKTTSPRKLKTANPEQNL